MRTTNTPKDRHNSAWTTRSDPLQPSLGEPVQRNGPQSRLHVQGFAVKTLKFWDPDKIWDDEAASPRWTAEPRRHLQEMICDGDWDLTRENRPQERQLVEKPSKPNEATSARTQDGNKSETMPTQDLSQKQNPQKRKWPKRTQRPIVRPPKRPAPTLRDQD